LTIFTGRSAKASGQAAASGPVNRDAGIFRQRLPHDLAILIEREQGGREMQQFATRRPVEAVFDRVSQAAQNRGEVTQVQGDGSISAQEPS
jgi:hypothetical protein